MAVNKPGGVPVQPDPSGSVSLLDHLQRRHQQELFLVHRLDRPVSGVVILAKSGQSAARLSTQFQNRVIDKYYLAVVRNCPDPPAGTVVHYLRKDASQNRSRVYLDPRPNTKRAALNYDWLCSSETYHLLCVQLLTGRHHQIRAQLGAMGCPVKGDVKYGFKRAQPNKQIYLHAWQLCLPQELEHLLVLTAPLPKEDPLWQIFNPTVTHLADTRLP